MNALRMITATDEITKIVAMRSEKIESARSITTAIRQQRQQQHETLEAKLLANEMGLTELRKIADTWKGEEITLHKLEGVVLMKEKECERTRKLVAGETFNRWGSMPRYPDFRLMYATPSAQTSQRQSSTQAYKTSTRRQLLLQNLETVVLMEEKRCTKTRKLVAGFKKEGGSPSSKSSPKKNSVTRRSVAPCA
jgi:hypothetical protein